MNSQYRNPHSVLIGLVLFVVSAAAADSVLAYDATISVTPTAVALAGNFSEAQLLVASFTDEATDKRSADLTTTAKYASSDD